MPTLTLIDDDFKDVIRLANTNLDGRQKVPYALRSIKGFGRRFAILCCKAAGIDANRRAGTLSEEERELLLNVANNPNQYKVPRFFLNRKNEPGEGKDMHVYANTLETSVRVDITRMSSIRQHKGLRHMWGLRVRGQHTKTTGRTGKTVGVSKKKG